MGLNEVSVILWRERQLLDLLLFKLEEEQLLLAAGRHRWLSRATREVEMVLAEIKHTELERAMEVDRLARDLGLPPGPSLRALAAVAPAPWSGILAEHREAFLALTEEVTGLVEANRELLSRGRRAVRDVIASLGGERVHEGEVAYGPPRAGEAVRGRPLLIDEAL